MLLAKLKSMIYKKQVVFIGLSEKDLEFLKKGEAILIEGKYIEIDQNIVISYGKKEKDIQKEFNIPSIN